MASERSFTVDSHSGTMLSQLNKQRMENSFCDVILQVQNKKFSAHRNVLSACSEYFLKMFTINMKEKHNEIVKFKDIDPKAMEILLDFLYTEKIVITEDNVSDILNAASIMQIADALDVVSTYLSDVLNCENCLDFCKIGQLHSLNKLLDEADQFILKHFEEISQQDAFFDLDVEKLVQLLASDELKVKKEQLVFEVVVKWVDKNVLKRKAHFSKLFHNVRLQYVPIKYVAGIIRKNKHVREFPDCRDLVEDAFFYRINPEMVVAEKPRKSFIPEPDSVLCININSQQLLLYNVSSKSSTTINCEGWEPNLIIPSCALATNYPNSVFCGGTFNNQASNQVIHFNGTCLSDFPSMNVSRCGAAAVYCKDELYVFGGEKLPIPIHQKYNIRSANLHKLNFADNFEVYTENWKVEDKLPTERSFAFAQVFDDKIYLMGGYTLPALHGRSQEYCKEATSTTAVFNVSTRCWNEGPVMRVARAQFGSTVLKSTIYVVGGLGSNNSQVAGAEFMKPGDGVWTAITGNNWNLYSTSACSLKNQIYVIGSNANMLYRYDPDNQQWSQEQGNVTAGSFVIPFVAQNQAG